MRDPLSRAHDDLRSGLANIMRVLLAASGVAVLVLGVLMIRDVKSNNQGEVYYIGGAMLALTVMIVDRLVKLRGR